MSIIGFFVFATWFIKLKSVISKEEILYKGGSNFFKKLKALMLKGVLNKIIFNFFASLKASLCQEKGVCTFL